MGLAGTTTYAASPVAATTYAAPATTTYAAPATYSAPAVTYAAPTTYAAPAVTYAAPAVTETFVTENEAVSAAYAAAPVTYAAPATTFGTTTYAAPAVSTLQTAPSMIAYGGPFNFTASPSVGATYAAPTYAAAAPVTQTVQA